MTELSVHEKVWKVIRNLRDFTYDDVCALTGVTYGRVTTYLLTLYQAGYIRLAGKRTEGDGRRKNIWRLVKSTGPKPPLLKRCLYDPNSECVSELKGAGYWIGPGAINQRRGRERLARPINLRNKK
jgi:hypothetical protein